jgi:hypothetical protein
LASAARESVSLRLVRFPDRLNEIAGTALEDVAERSQGGEVEALRGVGDEAVDLFP